MNHEPPPAQGPVDVNVSRLPACKGTNCGCTDGRSHSPECIIEHDAATALPYKVSSCVTNPDKST